MNINEQEFSVTNDINHKSNSNNNNGKDVFDSINMNEGNEYYDDYSISIPYACHELFCVLVPYIRFPEYIDKLISIIYKIIPYISFYVELVVKYSMVDDKYTNYENTILYYVSLLIEIIGYYTEDEEYYINQWNELIKQELESEKNSSIQTNYINIKYNNDSENHLLLNENQFENKIIFSQIIYNREILIKLILDFICNLINISNNDNYSNVFWNAINYILNIPSSHGIPSTLINILFNSNDVHDTDLNLLIHFVKHPQIWVRKHTFYELVQIEKNGILYNSVLSNNLHSVLIRNFDILISLINYGLLDDDFQVRQLTKLFIKYFVNSDPGNQILYNLILWLQLYDNEDLHSLIITAFNKIKKNCSFNKQIILWLRMLYNINEYSRKEGFSVFSNIFNEINELSSNRSSPWNIYYYTNTDVDIQENELIKIENNIYKKEEVNDSLLKAHILKAKTVLEDEKNLKDNIEELLNIMINIQKDNIKIKDDVLKEVIIFIINIVIEYSEILFNNELIAKYLLHIFLLSVQYKNKIYNSISCNTEINSQFIKNLIILSFHPNTTICYLIAKSLSFILFKSNFYQLYFNNKNDSFDEINENKININNSILPIYVIKNFRIYNDNVKGIDIFNYRRNENLEQNTLQKAWSILLGKKYLLFIYFINGSIFILFALYDLYY